LLQHVSAELRHLQRVYTPIFKTQLSTVRYNSYTNQTILISAANLKKNLVKYVSNSVCFHIVVVFDIAYKPSKYNFTAPSGPWPPSKGTSILLNSQLLSIPWTCNESFFPYFLLILRELYTNIHRNRDTIWTLPCITCRCAL